jgi:hypothetical protein
MSPRARGRNGFGEFGGRCLMSQDRAALFCARSVVGDPRLDESGRPLYIATADAVEYVACPLTG